MANYKITSVYAGKCLNIYGDNVTSLYNNQNVCLWADSGTNEQKWSISSLGAGVYVRTIINTGFGLNAYRSGTNWNCDVYPVSGNETDAAITFERSGNYYKIRLTNYSGRYLTAGGTANGSNVYWGNATGGNNQLWIVSGEGTTNPTSLSMPQNLNQRYTGNDSIIQQYGCCVCCACDVASYYRGANYSLLQMRNAGVYTTSNASCVWGNVPSASFSNYSGQSQSTYFSKIRTEINAGRPVLVYMVGTYQHWVVAYGYTGAGASNAEIKVLDPYGSSTSTSVGRNITLAAAMSTQGASTINKLVLTVAK